MRRNLLLSVFIISFFVPSLEVSAASLFGKVIEVNSGDSITIFNLNRPVRIRLLGVDAPEMNQPFGDVARQHLSDLVYEKSVLVEYSGIDADSSLTGRVSWNGADIGAQMIRDGVAWFDPNVDRLSANEREVYQQSQRAAQGERRGLWQAENPMAPWEFVRAQARVGHPVTSLNPTSQEAKPRRSGPVPELTNLTLMMSNMNAVGPKQTNPENAFGDLAWATSTTRKSWSQLQPPGEDFSVFVPDEGKRGSASAPYEGETIEINTYMVRDGWAFYSLVWFSGPTNGEKDEDALNSSIDKFLQGAGEGYRHGTGQNFDCKVRGRKNISQNGYAGFEYDLSTCTFPTYMRMYTRVTGNTRKVYVATVVFSEQDDNVMRFVKSFTISPAKKANPATQ